MPVPKIETVNAVTMEHGRDFAQAWFDGNIDTAFEGTDVLTYPGDDADQQAALVDLQDDITGRVFEAVKEQIAEAFVRIANAVIEEERRRVDAPLVPPRVETVEVVTAEHAETFIEEVHQRLIDSGVFTEALERTHVMTWPDGNEDCAQPETEAQKHFNEMADEIRDRLNEETKGAIAEAFVRIAGDVTSRERNRR